MERIASDTKTGNIISIFENEIKSIQKGIDENEKGRTNHIAVISEPFSGAEYILDKITGDNSQKIENIKLFSPIKNPDFFTNFYTKKEITLLRNCHYLYTRKPGGFDTFESFLNLLAASDRLFITGWNKFAWNYLNEISDIGSLFSLKVTVPELDSKSIMNMIMSKADEKISFIDDREPLDTQNLWVHDKYKISMPISQTKHELSFLKLNLSALSRQKKAKSTEDIQNEVFLKITRLAGGKYDVAQKIWKKSLKGNEIKLSKISEPQFLRKPNLNESFILSIILTMESVSYDELSQITGTEISPKRLLYGLIHQGLIEEHNNEYKINPEAVNLIIAYLKKIRMVW